MKIVQFLMLFENLVRNDFVDDACFLSETSAVEKPTIRLGMWGEDYSGSNFHSE